MGDKIWVTKNLSLKHSCGGVKGGGGHSGKIGYFYAILKKLIKFSSFSNVIFIFLDNSTFK